MSNPRNFESPQLSNEARKAVNAAFDAMTTWRTEVQAMDHIMDAWEEQIKSPNPSATMLSKLTSLPSFGQAGGWPITNASQMAPMNPFGIYMQVAQQWQKAWADSMAFWAKAGQPYSASSRK